MTFLPSMTAKVSRSFCYLLIVALSACGGGGSAQAPTPTPPPVGYVYQVPVDNGDTWPVANAVDQGVNPGLLEDMMDAVDAGQFAAIDSIAIARGGTLVFDETIRTALADNDSRVGNTNLAMHGQYSVSKSITSIVVGIAIDEGYISGVDVPYLSLFSYAGYDNWDERKNDMMLQDVLTMRLGLEWNEWDPPYTSPDNQLNRFYASEHDFSKALLDLPMTADPGTVFAYNTAATVSLGQAVENAAPLPLIDFGLSELMLPLGITDIEVTRTPTGLPDGGGGFYLLTRDAAKLGQLLLNGGSWNGERIVSSAWLDESLVPVSELGWADPEQWDWQVTGYGYQWWTGFYDNNGDIVDTFVAWGFGGQWVIAMPSLDLVVAINSHGFDGSDDAINQGHALVKRYILPALQ